nr:E3 ubiquitin-protein ligase ZFP91-like isoform X2 [Geotrypetes seraphini]XP_033773757.1 E3 ubiquitin-protein ligase ZFP91-like isoform X2 [Geotrypetes seraphini]XP_033773758.1 E3 ubiquitin-protein ligase ZFP91-like isoform X2 [Geotrypetes seraphini]
MDPGSCHSQRHTSDELRKQKRKELDARRGKCRIRIGAHLDQWCELKEKLGFSLHSQLAKFLLDRYSSSAGITYTEHLDTGLCVSSDALQQLAVLCHDHSQECGFIPNLIQTMSVGDKREADTLLWECLAGHSFSWSFSLQRDLDEVSSSHLRETETAKRTGSDISAAHLKHPCSSQSLPGQCTNTKQKEGMQGTWNDKKKREGDINQIGNGAIREIACTSEVFAKGPRETVCKKVIDGAGIRRSKAREESDSSSVVPLTDCRRSLRRVPAKLKRAAQSTPDVRVAIKQTKVPLQNSRWMPDSGNKPVCTELSKEGGLQSSLNVEIAAEKMVPGITNINAEEQIRSEVMETDDQEQAGPAVNKNDEAREAVRTEESNSENQAEPANTETEEGSCPEAVTDLCVDDGIKNRKTCFKQNDEDIAQIGKKRIRRTAKREILLCDFGGCSKIFSNRQYLNHHKKYQHEQQKTFTCSEPSCGKSFNFKKHLKEHEKRHSDKRDFICEFCARAFRTSSNLIIHRRIHTGEKPLQCEICGFTCRQKASLNWHMKKHDVDSLYQFSCDICGKKFEKKDNVLAHRTKKHARSAGDTALSQDSREAPPPMETTTVAIASEARTSQQM